MIGIRPDEYYQSEKYKKLKYVTIKTSLSHNDIEWCIDFDQVHYGEKKIFYYVCFTGCWCDPVGAPYKVLAEIQRTGYAKR